MFVWGFFWREDMVGTPICIFGCLGTVLGLYVLFLKFWGESLCIFESGLELKKTNKTVVFGYGEVTSISAKGN